MQEKLYALLAYAKRNRSHGLPTTLTALASAMGQSGVLGTSNLDGSRISKVATGERQFTDRVHAALLETFGITWPCQAYYDLDFGLDKNAQDFLRVLAVMEGAIVLVRERRNEVDFPLEDVYVMDLHEVPRGEVYCANVIAKPSTSPIIGDDGPLAGMRIGSAGFSQLSVRMELPAAAHVVCERPSEWRASGDFQVRDRSAGDVSLWQVRAAGEAAVCLDENIEVFQLSVSKFERGDRLVLVTTAPVPELTLTIDDRVVDREQQMRFQKIAQNQVLEKYRVGQGRVDTRQDVLQLGQVVLRRDLGN